MQKLGLKCDAYEDGKLAYEALQRASKIGNPYHLVLMDVQMPVLDGYNATRAIRKDEDRRVREVLVIAMTASAIRGDREKCLEAGMNDYLAKPVRQAALKEMLDEYLNNTRAAQHIISPDNISLANGSTESPGEKVNKETAKAPVKATTPIVEKPAEEVGLGSQVEKAGRIMADGEAPKERSTERPKPAPVQEAPTPKAKKKRIPLKGSARNKSLEESHVNGHRPSTPETNSQDSDATMRTTSPPSGVREQQVLGKLSTEVVSPPANGLSREKIEKELAKTVTERVRNAEKDQDESPKSPSIMITPPKVGLEQKVNGA